MFISSNYPPPPQINLSNDSVKQIIPVVLDYLQNETSSSPCFRFWTFAYGLDSRRPPIMAIHPATKSQLFHPPHKTFETFLIRVG